MDRDLLHACAGTFSDTHCEEEARGHGLSTTALLSTADELRVGVAPSATKPARGPGRTRLSVKSRLMFPSRPHPTVAPHTNNRGKCLLKPASRLRTRCRQSP